MHAESVPPRFLGTVASYIPMKAITLDDQHNNRGDFLKFAALGAATIGLGATGSVFAGQTHNEATSPWARGLPALTPAPDSSGGGDPRGSARASHAPTSCAAVLTTRHKNTDRSEAPLQDFG